MAASDPSERSSSAGTLTDEVIAEVIADWKNDEVQSGAQDSKVTFPCDRDTTTGKLLRSNRAYDVLEVARTTFTAPKGKKLGSRSKLTETKAEVPAVDAVAAVPATDDHPAVKAVAEVLYVPADYDITVFTFVKSA